MNKPILIKRILASLFLLAALAFVWYVYKEQFGPPPQEALPRANPTPARPTTRTSLARNRTTRPTTQRVTMTIDPVTGKITTSTSTAPIQPEPVDPFRVRQSQRHLTGHTDTIRALALSADSSNLLTGGNDFTVRLWDFASGKEIRRFEGHTAFVRGVGFSSDASRIITCSDDTTIRVWDVNTGEQLSQLEGHQRSVIAASFLFDSNLAVSASSDGSARLWEIDKEITVKRFDHDRQVCSMAVSIPHDLLAVGTHSGLVYLWDLKTRTQLRELERAPSCIEALVLSADGKKLIVCPAGTRFRVIDVATGKLLFEEDQREHETVWNAAISSDGNLLALGRGLEVFFYDLQTYKRCKTYLSPTVFIQAMHFVKETPLLITAGGGFKDTNDRWTRPHGEVLQVWKLPQPLP